MIKIFKKIVGVIFMVLGVVGAFVPIPIVPFFLLFFIGLGIYGVDKEKIQKLKNRFKKNKI
jgi:uncharacterized protein YqgC (DUF456 family)